jgi:hypothetical protein
MTISGPIWVDNLSLLFLVATNKPLGKYFNSGKLTIGNCA